MASISYNGKIITQSVDEINSVLGRIESLSSDIKSATNQIVSAKGFNEYIGGITSDSFSELVNECGQGVQFMVQFIKQVQIEVLSFSQDEKAIDAFLDGLDRIDYEQLDLTGIENHIGFFRKASNVFKGLGASAATFASGLVEGIFEFGETAADLFTMGGTAVASIFTGGYDLITGANITEQIWEDTKAKVSEKKVESIFNSFYADTEIGQALKNNAYGFDTCRSLGSGVGYSTAMIGATMLTGGLASGLGVGAAGSVGVTQMAATAGILGISRGSEDAWADGATLADGLKYGAATGAWEAAQWAIGAKISQVGGYGDKIASKLFKNSKLAGSISRVGLDTVDSGVEGFVQPALNMLYKDYDTGKGIFADYAAAFEDAGGWDNVKNQAIMGAVMSAGGEINDARKVLKEAKRNKDIDATTKADTDSTSPETKISNKVGEKVAGETILKETAIDGEKVEVQANTKAGESASAKTEITQSKNTPEVKEQVSKTPQGKVETQTHQRLGNDTDTKVTKTEAQTKQASKTQTLPKLEGDTGAKSVSTGTQTKQASKTQTLPKLEGDTGTKSVSTGTQTKQAVTTTPHQQSEAQVNYKKVDNTQASSNNPVTKQEPVRPSGGETTGTKVNQSSPNIKVSSSHTPDVQASLSTNNINQAPSGQQLTSSIATLESKPNNIINTASEIKVESAATLVGGTATVANMGSMLNVNNTSVDVGVNPKTQTVDIGQSKADISSQSSMKSLVPDANIKSTNMNTSSKTLGQKTDIQSSKVETNKTDTSIKFSKDDTIDTIAEKLDREVNNGRLTREEADIMFEEAGERLHLSEKDRINELVKENAQYAKDKDANIMRKEQLISEDGAKSESVKGYDEAVKQIDDQIAKNESEIESLKRKIETDDKLFELETNNKDKSISQQGAQKESKDSVLKQTSDSEAEAYQQKNDTLEAKTNYEGQYNKLLDKQKQYVEAASKDSGSIGTERYNKIINEPTGEFVSGRPEFTNAQAKVEGQIDGSALKTLDVNQGADKSQMPESRSNERNLSGNTTIPETDPSSGLYRLKKDEIIQDLSVNSKQESRYTGVMTDEEIKISQNKLNSNFDDMRQDAPSSSGKVPSSEIDPSSGSYRLTKDEIIQDLPVNSKQESRYTGVMTDEEIKISQNKLNSNFDDMRQDAPSSSGKVPSSETDPSSGSYRLTKDEIIQDLPVNSKQESRYTDVMTDEEIKVSQNKFNPNSDDTRQDASSPSEKVPSAYYTEKTIGPDYTEKTIGPDFSEKTIGPDYTEKTIGPDFSEKTIGPDFSEKTIGPDYTEKTIGPDYTEKTIGPDFSEKTIGPDFSEKTIGPDFSGKTIGPDYTEKTIGPNFSEKTIGPNFSEKTIGPDYTEKTIGPDFSEKTIGPDFSEKTIGPDFSEKTIGPDYTEKTIGPDFSEKTIGPDFSEKTIGPDFSEKTIGPDFSEKTIGPDFSEKTIGPDYTEKTIGPDFSEKTIGPDFSEKTIGPDFSGKTIGPDFSEKTIGPDYTEKTIGPDFSEKTIGPDFSEKTIGPDFSEKTIGPDYTEKTIGPDYTEKTIGPDFSEKTIGPDFSEKTIGPNFSEKTIGPDYTEKTIGPDFSEKTIGPDYTEKTIGPDFSEKTIGPDYTEKTIGPDYTEKTIGPDFSEKTIGPDYTEKTIGPDFSEKTIGPDYTEKTIGPDFSEKTIGPDFSEKTIGPDFSEKTIGPDYTEKTIGPDFSEKTIGPDFSEKTIGPDFSEKTISTIPTKEEIVTDLNKILSEKYGSERTVYDITIGDRTYNEIKYGREIADKLDVYRDLQAKELGIPEIKQNENISAKIKTNEEIITTPETDATISEAEVKPTTVEPNTMKKFGETEVQTPKTTTPEVEVSSATTASVVTQDFGEIESQTPKSTKPVEQIETASKGTNAQEFVSPENTVKEYTDAHGKKIKEYTDASGNKITETTRKNGSQETKIESPDGTVTSIVKNSEKQLLNTKKEYTDVTGKRIKETEFYDPDYKIKTSKTTEIEYTDKNGNPVKEITREESGQIKSINKEYTDVNGNKVKETEINGKEGTRKRKETKHPDKVVTETIDPYQVKETNTYFTKDGDIESINIKEWPDKEMLTETTYRDGTVVKESKTSDGVTRETIYSDETSKIETLNQDGTWKTEGTPEAEVKPTTVESNVMKEFGETEVQTPKAKPETEVKPTTVEPNVMKEFGETSAQTTKANSSEEHIETSSIGTSKSEIESMLGTKKQELNELYSEQNKLKSNLAKEQESFFAAKQHFEDTNNNIYSSKKKLMGFIDEFYSGKGDVDDEFAKCIDNFVNQGNSALHASTKIDVSEINMAYKKWRSMHMADIELAAKLNNLLGDSSFNYSKKMADFEYLDGNVKKALNDYNKNIYDGLNAKNNYLKAEANLNKMKNAKLEFDKKVINAEQEIKTLENNDKITTSKNATEDTSLKADKTSEQIESTSEGSTAQEKVLSENTVKEYTDESGNKVTETKHADGVIEKEITKTNGKVDTIYENPNAKTETKKEWFNFSSKKNNSASNIFKTQADSTSGTPSGPATTGQNTTSVLKYNKFTSYNEFKAVTANQTSQWRADLTPQQVTLIKNYVGESTTSSYKTMNGLARGTLIDFDNKTINIKDFTGYVDKYSFDDWYKMYNETPDQLIKRTEIELKNLNAAIKASKIDSPITVYRAAADTMSPFTSMGLSGTPTLEKLQSLIGKTYSEKGFTSCSPTYPPPFDKKIEYEMDLPQGTSLANFAEWNNCEKETLLELGQEFIIDGVREEHGKFIIHMTARKMS